MSKRKEDDMSSDHTDGDEAAKTAMYLVLEHAVEEPAYSVFRVEASAGAADAADGSRRARHLVRIPNPQHGMSFAAVHSKRGRSWIVGVGGDTTIYYDPTHDDEDRQFQQGPRPMSAKRDPVLISHDGKLYSFSRRYKVDPDAGYEPWFEYLSLGEDRGPGHGFWSDLLPPPFPPFVLTPLQYLDPPEIRVLAYAAVGSYIVLSLEPGGTFAFHVRKVTWAKVDDKNLPFVGDAVPLGGNYFASRSKAGGGATAVFYLKVFDATSSEPARLSVVEFPVVTSQSSQLLGGGQQLLCPLVLGAGASFCSVDFMSSRHSSSSQPGMLKTAQVVVTPCQMNVKEETAELQVLSNDEQRQIYRFCDRTRLLASPMPLVAALSMRNFEEKPRKKKAAPPHIIVAPMLATPSVPK